MTTPNAPYQLIGNWTEDIVYVGWIAADRRHRTKLHKLGVQGKMAYRAIRHFPTGGAFEHCEASKEVLQKVEAQGWVNGFSPVERTEQWMRP